MPIRSWALVVLLGVGRTAVSQVTLPTGTPLVASVPTHLPLRVGEAIESRLRYDVYVNDAVAVPAGTRLEGTISALTADHAHRLQSRLRGDFTPFSTPVVQFDRLVLGNGSSVAVQTSAAVQGAPIFRLVAPPPRTGGFVRRHLDEGKQMVKDRLAVVTGPDKRDRLVQFVYTQLPYHPQRIQEGTAWTVETTAPVELGKTVAAEAARPQAAAEGPELKTVAAVERSSPPTWIVNAFLDERLDSRTSKAGQTIRATVAEPIYNADGTLAVPQGAVLEGSVTQAKAARWFGRGGVLRFDFRQLNFPSGKTQNVQASLTGIDSAGGGDLAMDSEGKVKPKSQDKVGVPLILLALASRPLDRDHGDNQFGKDAVASNALGLAGFIVGTAARAPNFAAGIGYYGTALAIYNRWIKRGADVTFVKDTRVEVQTTARRSAVLRSSRR